MIIHRKQYSAFNTFLFIYTGVMGNRKHVLPVLQCLKRGIAFVSSILFYFILFYFMYYLFKMIYVIYLCMF